MISPSGDADDEWYEPLKLTAPSSAAAASKGSLGFSGNSNLHSLISKFETKPSQDKPKLDIPAPSIKSPTSNRNTATRTEDAKTETRNLKTGTDVGPTKSNGRKNPSISTRPPQPPPFEGPKTGPLGSPANRPVPPAPRPLTTEAVHVDTVTGRKYRLLRLLPQPPGSRPPKKPSKANHLRKLTFNNFVR